jgi:NADH dehydrogenase FAD-containing subunit
VVIVGASFAGLFLTRKLIKLLGATAESEGRVEIVMVEKNEYFENTCSIPYAL